MKGLTDMQERIIRSCSQPEVVTVQYGYYNIYFDTEDLQVSPPIQERSLAKAKK